MSGDTCEVGGPPRSTGGCGPGWTAPGLLEHARYTGRGGIATWWVLRATGEAGMKTGSRSVAFAVRSLSVATGVDPTTAPRSSGRRGTRRIR